MSYKKRLTRLMVKYVVKKPIIFFCVVIIGVSIFLALTLNTQVPIIKTYKAELKIGNGNIILTLTEEINDKSFDTIYFYTDRNKSVYKLSDFSIFGKQITITSPSEIESILKYNPSSTVTVDIPQGEISLFNQIFIKGGKG